MVIITGDNYEIAVEKIKWMKTQLKDMSMNLAEQSKQD